MLWMCTLYAFHHLFAGGEGGIGVCGDQSGAGVEQPADHTHTSYTLARAHTHTLTPSSHARRPTRLHAPLLAHACVQTRAWGVRGLYRYDLLLGSQPIQWLRGAFSKHLLELRKTGKRNKP